MEISPELESLINEARNKLSALIQRPKMTEKLLAKPPVRFLHDTITAITNATGFAEGLYNETELDSNSLNDKQAKLSYLDKIFTLVGICKGAALEVKSAKVISGLEPERTNEFLIALAECASDASIDNQSAVQRCLSGAQPGDRPPPRKAESKAEASKTSSSRNSAPPTDSESKSEVKMPDMESIAQERGKSRGGTRAGKPQQLTGDVGLGGISGVPAPPNLDSEIERCDGTEQTTQALLGELIQRPKLSEKLLGKPPFRFLHDIVMEVIKNTGFASTLYTPEECDSSMVTEKAQKMMFLEKVIKVVGVQLNTLVEAKPAKIVSGFDAPITNNFLQLLAVAAKHLPDSRNAVRTVLEQLGQPGGNTEEVPTNRNVPNPTLENSGSNNRRMEDGNNSRNLNDGGSSFQQSNDVMNPNSRAEEKRNAVPEERQSKPISSRQQNVSAEPKEPVPSNSQHGGEDETGGGDDFGSEMKRSTRPTTARRRPPKVKDGAKELQVKDIAPAVKKASGIIIDGANNDDEDEDAIVDNSGTAFRLVDDVRSESKGTQGGSDAQSKLVKDILSRQAEQEAAVRGNKTEIVDDSKSSTNDSNSQGGIRLGKLRKTGVDKKQQQTNANAGGLGEGDLEKMRKSIQILVQHTGPLGTCMDYVQEDIKMMSDELHRWEEECVRYEAEYDESKRNSKEVLQPLKQQLRDLESQIIEQISKISATKASIARNDDKIQQILKLVATA